MAITQKQIAHSLGVSHQLVSYALNGGGTVSEQKRREILDAAREMGYRRNELARAMVTGKSHLLGLLTYGDTGEHISTIVTGALHEAAKAGYAVKVLHVPYGGSRQEVSEVAHRCTSWQLDGAMAVSLYPDALEVLEQQLGRGRCPVVYVENAAKADDLLVRTDDRSAFRAAIEHLVELGHRRIVHLCGPDHPISRSRNAIFLEMLAEFGLPVGEESLIPTHPIEWGHRQSIEAATHALLDRSSRPTAVICAGDASAMTVMRVAQQRGFRVPGDLSVIGFGNFDLGAHAFPPVTTIAQPFLEMGRLATQRLIEHIELSAGDAVSTALCPAATARGIDELPAHLVVRESTAPPAL